MERVHFQQEQMLIELKDLVQKGLFTQKEVKHIVQKRTAFETALVRRIPKKSDFLRYATYEMSLEALRKKRAEQLEIAKGPQTVSDYALVRRQFQIFERALNRFKGDIGLWIQYIQVAKKEGARSLVGRITARALQLHPNVPALYVLAASHELAHLSPTAARALLQRGLRLNADSVEMWREYVRMEMGFVENLRRRWSVLGIDASGKAKETAVPKNKGTDTEKETDLWRSLGEENEPVAAMVVDTEEEHEEDETARRQIMAGAIVKSTISSAVKALPQIELFVSLHELISAYPSPTDLRESLLDHLHAQLHKTLPSLPSAIKLTATRHLTRALVGEPLVDALKSANEELLAAVRSAMDGTKLGVANVYAEFVEEWCSKVTDDSLKAYLITSVHILIRQLPAPVPPELLAAHVRLLASHQGSLRPGLLPPKVNTPEKILRASRRHTNNAPSSAAVWLARLDVERRFAEQDAVHRAWSEARRNVRGDGIQGVWLWGLELQDRPLHPNSDASTTLADAKADVRLLEQLLHEKELMQEPAATAMLREALLIRYAAASHRVLLHSAQVMRNASTIGPAGSPSGSLSEQRGGAIGMHAHAQHNGLRQDSRPSHQGHAIPGIDSSILEARLARVRRIGSMYVPTARVWCELFGQETTWTGAETSSAGNTAEVGIRGGGLGVTASRGHHGDADGDLRVLRSVYEFWRQTDGVEATTAWCTWLLRHGYAKEAVAVVGRVRSVLGETDGEMVERRWKAVVDKDADVEGDEGGHVAAGDAE